jgi:hypothetical protein
MPQVKCPNCGTTINLETRKETDFNLIINALHRNPKTFTQLLNQTRLPRKTLSLRLNELCNLEIIVKDGGYRLSESYLKRKLWGEKVSTMYGDMRKSLLYSKKNVLLLLILLGLGLPVAANVYARLSYQLPKPTQPKYVSTFVVLLKIRSVYDLYAWQVNIRFNPDMLQVLDVKPGEFFPEEYPFFLNTPLEETVDGTLLLGATLCGERPGVDGNGTLAKITFGVKQEGSYSNPEIVFGGEDGFGFGTFIQHSDQISTYECDFNVRSLFYLEVVG